MSPASGSRGDEVLSVLNPADESHVADVSVTPLGEIGRAVEEARRSFDEGVWSGVPARERGAILHSFLDHVEATRAQLVNTMVAEAGQPRRFAEMTQLDAGVSLARATIDLYLSMPEEEPNPVPLDELVRGRVALSIRRYEPVGVVSAITPYNAALHHGLPEVGSGPHGRELGDPSAQPAHTALVARPGYRRRCCRPTAGRTEHRGGSGLSWSRTSDL